MKHFTDLILEDYADKLLDPWVTLNIEPWRYNYLAQKWACPKNIENRSKLSAEQWEKERQLFLSCGKNVDVFEEAEICATYFNQYGKNYLVWLKFLGPDNEVHTIDTWINEFGKNSKNAEKFIDPRSPLCQDIYNAIITTGYISKEIAKLLPTVGAKSWSDATEQKVQKKLNSYIQQKIFEDLAKKCNIQLTQLDEFDDYLYRGDPGNIADYDLQLTTANGVSYKVRIDLKLLENNNTSKDQNPHDAWLLITSEWRTGKVAFYRVKGTPDIEDTLEFKQLLSTFNKDLLTAGKCFLHIDKIDLDTGKVDYKLFGNNS